MPVLVSRSREMTQPILGFVRKVDHWQVEIIAWGDTAMLRFTCGYHLSDPRLLDNADGLLSFHEACVWDYAEGERLRVSQQRAVIELGRDFQRLEDRVETRLRELEETLHDIQRQIVRQARPAARTKDEATTSDIPLVHHRGPGRPPKAAPEADRRVPQPV
jgi:hypothetical protein